MSACYLTLITTYPMTPIDQQYIVFLKGRVRLHKSIVPNSITMTAMLLSFLAIIYIIEGRYISAAWFIWFSGMLDAADGGVARLLKTSSDFGKQLDSLTDVVGSGVAPALLLYSVYFSTWGIFAGLLLSFMFVGVVTSRLANFNLRPSHDRQYFSGLSAPIAAGLMAHIVIFSADVWGGYPYAGVVLCVMLLACGLMLSNLPYAKTSVMLPRRLFRSWPGWLTIITILVGMIYPSRVVLGFIIVYIALNTARAIRLKFSQPASS
jgi:CDP-diacylglycerol---serine O-phosphatidyltransferase